MDLYEPLYFDRPVVKPELYASLRPRTYDQDLADKEEQFRAAGLEIAGRRVPTTSQMERRSSREWHGQE